MGDGDPSLAVGRLSAVSVEYPLVEIAGMIVDAHAEIPVTGTYVGNFVGGRLSVGGDGRVGHSLSADYGAGFCEMDLFLASIVVDVEHHAAQGHDRIVPRGFDRDRESLGNREFASGIDLGRVAVDGDGYVILRCAFVLF